MNQLKLFVNKAWMPPGKKHVHLLYPFWGNLDADATDPDFGRFDDYTLEGKKALTLVNSIASCDAVVLPFEFSFEDSIKERALDIARWTELQGKRLIVFFNNDSDDVIPLEKALIFRTSIYKSHKGPTEFALPAWSKDPYKQIPSDFRILAKAHRPSISYCGYLDYLTPSFRTRLRNFRKSLINQNENLMYDGRALRGKACRILHTDKRVDSQFIVRTGFWAPGLDKQTARIEYLHNMYSNPYALVARGAGNFSYRFYEALSCGRIPVMIDTDCLLPFPEQVKWADLIPIIPISEIDTLCDRLVEFHEQFTDQEFRDLQLKLRKLYTELLSPNGFFSNIHQLIKPVID